MKRRLVTQAPKADRAPIHKTVRGSASQFFIAGELCRRGAVAVVTMGNCPNTDILCSNTKGTRFAHIQVKTFRPGDKTCPVGEKAETEYGDNFFWILGGIPQSDSSHQFVYYVIPSPVMAREIRRNHQKWLDTPGKRGQPHNPTNMRCIELPPRLNHTGWSIEPFRNRWDLVLKCLGGL